MALSSRLPLSCQVSGIWQDIRYYLTGYPVRQLVGYQYPALKIAGYLAIWF